MYFYILIAVALLSILSSANAQRVITATDVCLRDTDCVGIDQYCDYDSKECVPIVKRGGECNETRHCDFGLYCGSRREKRVCLPQIPLFQPCDPTYTEPCARDKFVYKCSRESFTCEFIGFRGDKCINFDDCQNEGNYCKDEGAINGGKCTMQKRAGQSCSADQTGECEGYCVLGDDGFTGKCADAIPIGGRCSSDQQCQGYSRRFNRSPNVVCNIAKGTVGTCLDERDLIKVAGTTCKLFKDSCDAARGLSCRPTPTGPKCMFQSFKRDLTNAYCDPSSEYSKCNNKEGFATECRVGDFPAFFSRNMFYECLRKTAFVEQGMPCNHVEHARCPEGTACQPVPGVRQQVFEFSRIAKFCVAVRKEGEKCFNKFRFACEDGLKCQNNVCVKGTPDSTITHAYVDERCDSLPCVPGTECKNSFGRNICQLTFTV